MKYLLIAIAIWWLIGFSVVIYYEIRDKRLNWDGFKWSLVLGLLGPVALLAIGEKVSDNR